MEASWPPNKKIQGLSKTLKLTTC